MSKTHAWTCAFNHHSLDQCLMSLAVLLQECRTFYTGIFKRCNMLMRGILLFSRVRPVGDRDWCSDCPQRSDAAPQHRLPGPQHCYLRSWRLPRHFKQTEAMLLLGTWGYAICQIRRDLCPQLCPLPNEQVVIAQACGPVAAFATSYCALAVCQHRLHHYR